MSENPPQFLLGTCGWAHRDWVGTFYPQDMPAGEYLTAYARQFHTVEIEHTFFEMPTRHTVQSWYRRTPDDFLFSPCLPRQITHTQRLRDVQGRVEDFLAIIGELGHKLGPILVQMPEDFRSTEHAALEAFLQILPRTQHFALEFHHGSWLKDTTFRLLEAHHVAWVVVDAAFLPRVPQVTAAFAYVRWHGRPGYHLRRQFDPTTALQPWVSVLRTLARQAQPVYGYVHNRFSGHAPRDCQLLQTWLGQDA